MNIITSAANDIYKEIKQLNNKKFREEKELFLAEGIRFVEEVFLENAKVEAIAISESFFKSEAHNRFLRFSQDNRPKESIFSDKLFKGICDTENPQGIIAIVHKNKFNFDEILDKSDFIICLDALQDPGNLGTIMRTADAAGVKAIIASKETVDVYNSKVLRATMGAIFRIPIFYVDNLREKIIEIKKLGFKFFVTHLKGKENYFKENYVGKTAIIIGNEGNGISNEVANEGDCLIQIPMPGKAESLNAAVAAGVLMYEVVRQRIK